jgi:hypothetical protein
MPQPANGRGLPFRFVPTRRLTTALSLITDGEFPTALGTAAREDLSSVFRLHPLPEPVGILSMTVARLEGSLHVFSLKTAIASRFTQKRGLHVATL